MYHISKVNLILMDFKCFYIPLSQFYSLKLSSSSSSIILNKNKKKLIALHEHSTTKKINSFLYFLIKISKLNNSSYIKYA